MEPVRTVRKRAVLILSMYRNDVTQALFRARETALKNYDLGIHFAFFTPPNSTVFGNRLGWFSLR